MKHTTPQDIIISPATREDIPALAPLIGQLFSLEPEYLANLDAQKRGLALLMERPDRGVVICARHGRDLIGMVSCQLVASTAMGGPSAWLEDMVVHRDFRGMGIGSRLMEAGRLWALHMGALRVQALVDRDNDAAFRFYRKHLFVHGRMEAISCKL